LRVTGIFTGTTSSPSNSLRQSYDRYAIRAGRNLPDKEFRYLRTVIVTAAVHCGPLAWALLLPKLRSQFAEFLNELSLERLWIFSSSTCVGLGYGSLCSP